MSKAYRADKVHLLVRDAEERGRQETIEKIASWLNRHLDTVRPTRATRDAIDVIRAIRNDIVEGNYMRKKGA